MSYILSFWYNAYGDGMAYPQPHMGDYVGPYGSASCQVSTWSFIVAGGNQTGLNASFGTTNQLYGVAGSVTYAGNLGNVDGCHFLTVELWPTGTALYGSSGSVTCALCSPMTSKSFNVNGIPYSEVALSLSANVCSSQNVNVLAYYHKPGSSCCGIQPGDPYQYLTNVATAPTYSQNITIADTTTY